MKCLLEFVEHPACVQICYNLIETCVTNAVCYAVTWMQTDINAVMQYVFVQTHNVCTL